MSLNDPKAVMKSLGIKDSLEKLVFCTYILAYGEARHIDNMTGLEEEKLLKESIAKAKKNLEELRKE